MEKDQIHGCRRCDAASKPGRQSRHDRLGIVLSPPPGKNGLFGRAPRAGSKKEVV